MAEHVIVLHGCDESTTVTCAVSDEIAQALQAVALQTRMASQSSCEPFMTVDGIGKNHHA